MKKITYIHQHFQLPEEGGGMRPWEFARRLVDDGFVVTVIGGGDSNQQFTRSGLTVIRVKAPYDNSMSMAARIRSFVAFLIRASVKAMRIPADVVFASSTPLTVAIPGLVATVFRKREFVFEVRDLWPSVPIELGYLRSTPVIWVAKLLEKITYRRADRIIALSPGMAEGILAVDANAQVTVVPNAADTELFSKSEAERREIRKEIGWSDKPVAIYAGSFGDTYRIPWIIELANKVRELDFQIVGEGSSSVKAQQLAQSYGLDTSAVLPGKLSRSEVASRIAAADMCICSMTDHPALHVNSFNKVFDALAAGRPILFNHGGWLSEMCVDHGAGWRVSADATEAAHQVQEIVKDSEYLIRASKASYSLAQEFDREKLYVRFRDALIGSSTS